MAKQRGNPNWQKGKSGNPTGRPKKGQTFTELTKDYLETIKIEANGKMVDGKKAIIMKMVSLALQGDVACLKYIWDRIDGPMQAMIQEVTDQTIIIGLAKKPEIAKHEPRLLEAERVN